MSAERKAYQHLAHKMEYEGREYALQNFSGDVCRLDSEFDRLAGLYAEAEEALMKHFSFRCEELDIDPDFPYDADEETEENE